MLTGSDQQFLVQLVGYTLGFGGAVVAALYMLYRCLKGVEDVLKLLAKMMFKNKKIA